MGLPEFSMVIRRVNSDGRAEERRVYIPDKKHIERYTVSVVPEVRDSDKPKHHSLEDPERLPVQRQVTRS